MSEGKRSTWAWLVGDTDSFADSYWGRRTLHRSVDDLSRMPLDLDLLDGWLTHGARRPSLRMVRAGGPLDEQTYTRAVRIGGRWVNGVADPTKVAARLGEGATLVAQNLEVTLPSIRRFAADVRAEISHPVQVNAYLTPPDAAGLGRHADAHDVVVLQVEGTKSWNVDGIGEVELTPGSVLYVPRGTAHVAWTGRAASLHLTLGVLCVTLADVVRRMLHEVPGDDERLPLGFASLAAPCVPTDVAAYLRRVGAAVEGLDGRSVDALVATRTRPVEPGGLARSLPSPLGSDDVVRRPTPCTWRREGDRCVLVAADRTVSFPDVAAEALRVVCERTTFAADDLPGLDPPSRLVLVRRLLREGVLVRTCAPATAAPAGPAPERDRPAGSWTAGPQGRPAGS